MATIEMDSSASQSIRMFHRDGWSSKDETGEKERRERVGSVLEVNQRKEMNFY